MKSTVILTLISLFITFQSGLFAAMNKNSRVRTEELSAEQRYGLAGCGLGSVIIGNKPGFTQVFAATSNTFLGNQTFAMSFGTSNCKPDKYEPKDLLIFIESNQEFLAKDIARGEGETLNHLAKIAGCKNSKAFGAVLKQNLDLLLNGVNMGQSLLMFTDQCKI